MQHERFIMLKTVGSSGQLTLGKKYSGQHFEVEERAGGELLLRPVRLVRATVTSGRAKSVRAPRFRSLRSNNSSCPRVTSAMPGASEGSQASTFVDTNIWVYAHLSVPGDKRHERALTLVQSEAGLVISPLVVAEYYNVICATRRTMPGFKPTCVQYSPAPACSPRTPTCWLQHWTCAIAMASRSGIARLLRPPCKRVVALC